MRHVAFKDLPALHQLQRDLLAGVALLDQILAPAGELIGPRLDRVTPAPDPVGPEAGHPAVVVVKYQRRLSPGLVLEGVFQCRGNDVVAVAEYVGPDRDLVADHPLRRVAAAVD